MNNNSQYKIFATNLKRLLDRDHKTQKEVADAIHISPQTFNVWYRGIAFPRMDKLQALSEYFNVSKSELIEPNDDILEDHDAINQINRFKDNLYSLRVKKGISQAKLAQELKMSTGIIGMYECGKRMPSIEALKLIADYFNVTLDYLIGRSKKCTPFSDIETTDISCEILKNPKLKALFLLIKDIGPKDLELITDLLLRLKELSANTCK